MVRHRLGGIRIGLLVDPGEDKDAYADTISHRLHTKLT
jgi:hypothetical protein